MELFTERLKLKDVMPEKAKDIAKEYGLKENEIDFVRKSNPINPDDIKIEDSERAAIRYINTPDLDRDGEIVMPDGGIIKDYQKNPTVLYSHDYRGLPIGKDIWIKLVKGKGWLAKTIYANHQLANDVYNLVKEKFLNSSSIGFIALETINSGDKGWDKVKEKLVKDWSILEDTVNQAKRIITKWILLEHSDVPLPSNTNALNIAVGKGFEIKSKELIEDLKIEIIDDKPEEKIEVITKPETTENYHHVPAPGEEGKHNEHKIRTMDISAEKGIKGRYCVDCKKMISYLFDVGKWSMEEAKKWVADNAKSYEKLEIDFENEITLSEEGERKLKEALRDIKEGKIEEVKFEVKEEVKEEVPNENKDMIELATKYGILLAEKTVLDSEIKIRDQAIKELEEKVIEIELKQGAVLNKKNKSALKEAQDKIQSVLDSAEPASEGIEIEAEKEVKEVKEEKQNGIDISANDIKDIINSAIKAQVNNATDKFIDGMNNSIKKFTGKVM